MIGVRVIKACVLLKIAPRSTLIIFIRNSKPRFKKGIARNVGSEQGQNENSLVASKDAVLEI